MTHNQEYNPSHGFFFHGPYNSIDSLPADHPARSELYLDPNYSEQATTFADAHLLAESRYQADAHGAAVEATMESAHRQGYVAPMIGEYMIAKVLDYYYFWPLEPAKQIKQVQAANAVVARIKQRNA